MVSQRSPIEALLGIKAPSAAAESPIAPPIGPGAGGMSADVARMLTGESSPAMPPGMGETQVGAPPSPMSDPVPPQNPPTGPVSDPSGQIPSSGATGSAGAPNQALSSPNAPENADIVKDFWARHGRAPTTVDIQMMHAIPMIERQLGRPPMRIEVLQMLGARQETPSSGALQFEPDTPDGVSGAAPMAAAMPPPSITPASGGGSY